MDNPTAEASELWDMTESETFLFKNIVLSKNRTVKIVQKFMNGQAFFRGISRKEHSQIPSSYSSKSGNQPRFPHIS